MIKLIFRFFSFWPLWLLHAVGEGLGWLVYALSSNYRLKMHEHAAVAFPDPMQRKKVVHASVPQAGMALLELPFLWGRSTNRGAAAVTRIENKEVFERAMAKGKGVIFLTPHLGSFESTAQAFSTIAPITVLYRPNRNAEIQAIIESSRARNNVAIAPTNMKGVKILLKALRRGEAVGMLPDQVPSINEGVWAPMFGKPAYTMTLPASLHHTTGASIVLALGIRLSFGRGFRLVFEEGPENLSKVPEEAAKQINQALEKLILKYPEQYYWGYERYKEPRG